MKPGDDFFQYANGKALEKLVIPSDRTSYGSFALLRELSDNRMKELVLGLANRTDLTPGSGFSPDGWDLSDRFAHNGRRQPVDGSLGICALYVGSGSADATR